MAISPYPYMGYQPYYQQPVPDQLTQLRMQQQNQPMQNVQPMPIQPQAMQQPISQPSMQNNGIIWVSSKQEADGYLIAPGSAVALWDSSAPVIYLRQADNTGKPSTKVYDLVERADSQTPPQAPKIDWSNFITRDELEEILTERLKKNQKTAKAKDEE